MEKYQIMLFSDIKSDNVQYYFLIISRYFSYSNDIVIEFHYYISS